ncbi:MAG: SoxR reducing system RseC family protein [Tannerellaceae bacterium]|jgi:sigma-E factor negative regulatory protein RseC|nr:SoxR reducing system RseC family protein [Tannerellaceae bacterium]
MGNSVNYCGVIERIEGHTIYVKVVQQPTCACCHAKVVCATAGGKEQIIETTDYSGTFHASEPVVLEGRDSMALQAVWLAFVIPLALVVSVVLIGTSLQWEESTGALIGLLLLFPYYTILYIFRNVLKKKFVFIIKKINPDI